MPRIRKYPMSNDQKLTNTANVLEGLPIKYIHILSVKDRIFSAWMCLIGRALQIAYFIPKNEFYTKSSDEWKGER